MGKGQIQTNWGNIRDVGSMSQREILNALLGRCYALASAAIVEGHETTPGERVIALEAISLLGALSGAETLADVEVLRHIASHGAGPYSHGGATGLWHKGKHAGPESCAGCALEAAVW